jgi:hypothetical protein
VGGGVRRAAQDGPGAGGVLQGARRSRGGGGGESFLRVHWVAVPKAMRARRVNRRRCRAGARGAAAAAPTMAGAGEEAAEGAPLLPPPRRTRRTRLTAPVCRAGRVRQLRRCFHLIQGGLGRAAGSLSPSLPLRTPWRRGGREGRSCSLFSPSKPQTLLSDSRGGGGLAVCCVLCAVCWSGAAVHGRDRGGAAAQAVHTTSASSAGRRPRIPIWRD